MSSNRISAIGSIRLPTKPTLNSRPATYSWTSTSSNCSSIRATRFLSARLEVQTAPLSIPTLASSADGFTMAGSGNSAGVLLAWASVNAGTGRPAADEQRVGDVLPVADGGGPVPAAGEGHTGELEGADDEILEAGVAVDPLAQVEDEVGTPDARQPAEVAQPNRQQLHLMAPAPENIPDLVDVAHDRGHVLGAPLVASSIVQDRHTHSGYLRQE